MPETDSAVRDHLARVLAWHEAHPAFDDAVADGILAELYWCPDSGHNAPDGMPADVCADEFAGWTRDFFDRALVSRSP